VTLDSDEISAIWSPSSNTNASLYSDSASASSSSTLANDVTLEPSQYRAPKKLPLPTTIDYLDCRACKRQYRSQAALDAHYKTSSAHPSCAPCEKGFKDDDAYYEHIALAHHPLAAPKVSSLLQSPHQRSNSLSSQHRSASSLSGSYTIPARRQSSVPVVTAEPEILEPINLIPRGLFDSAEMMDDPFDHSSFPIIEHSRSPSLCSSTSSSALQTPSSYVFEPKAPRINDPKAIIQRPTDVAVVTVSETNVDLPPQIGSDVAMVQQTPTPPSLVSSLLTCRVCEQPPVEATATLCGHIFCHSCIMQELSKTLSCPVCKNMMLLRLNVPV